MASSRALLTACLLAPATVFAQGERGLELMQRVLAQAQALHPPREPAARPQPVADHFDAPTDHTWELISARIKGLDRAAVKSVPPALLEEWLSRAAAQKMPYLNFLTAERFAGGSVYHFTDDALRMLERKFLVGALPNSGVDKSGKPFRVAAIILGAGRVAFLYDRADEFRYESIGKTFKIAPGGIVSGRIAGRGVLTDLRGLSADAFILGWAEFRKWAIVDGKLESTLLLNGHEISSSDDASIVRPRPAP